MRQIEETPRHAMLVWLNGAFGAGKTSVGKALVRCWSEAQVFDPEEIGFMLRRVVPRQEQTGDFQDLPLWRQLTVATAMGLLQGYRRPLIVPMTLVDRRYFDEVVGELRRRGVDVRHFALLASRATLRRRLRRRWTWPSSKRWALAQVDRCVALLEAPEFAKHLNTDQRRVDEVAEQVLAELTQVHSASPRPTSTAGELGED